MKLNIAVQYTMHVTYMTTLLVRLSRITYTVIHGIRSISQLTENHAVIETSVGGTDKATNSAIYYCNHLCALRHAFSVN